MREIVEIEKNVAVNSCVAGTHRDRVAIGGDGFLESAQLHERASEIVASFGAVRLDLQDGAKLGDGFLELARILQRDPKVVVRLRVVGL